MRKSSERFKKSRFLLYDKLPERSRTILVWVSVILFFAISLLLFLNKNLGDRTMTNCTVSSPNSTQIWTKVPIETSCGYVYIDRHQNSSNSDAPFAVARMTQAIQSGRPVTIRATGITGLLMAYEITPTE